ncbi:MAG: hypothetical protein M3R68_06120, partial [Acidobacteriota bacterium]|nr:hypothetical protein [Acidobacteriota bacterium]
MINAISTIISKTIDLFLKINSSESRRRKFAKDIFEVYKSLDEVVQALEGIESTIKQIAEIEDSISWSLDRKGLPEYLIIGAWSSEGIEIRTWYLDDDGSEKISTPRLVTYEEILPTFLSGNIRALNRAFGKLARIMSAQSWDLYQSDILKALEIYD